MERKCHRERKIKSSFKNKLNAGTLHPIGFDLRKENIHYFLTNSTEVCNNVKMLESSGGLVSLIYKFLAGMTRVISFDLMLAYKRKKDRKTCTQICKHTDRKTNTDTDTNPNTNT